MIHEWWRQEHPLTFTWDLWYACNYRCSYCWWEMENLWAELAKRHRVLSPEAWAEIWGRVHARHGEARIDVLGGEPLLYPRAVELLAALSRQHRLVVTTNLSPEPDAVERMARALSPERVHFNISFHPQYATAEAVMDKIGRLRAHGYLPGVLFVTWPPFLERMDGYRRFFQAAGVPFSPMVFQGEHEGRRYPDAYTAAERALIEGTMAGPAKQKEDEREYRLDARATKGKPCHAGRVYANIKADGQVFRCGQDAFGQKPMGNLFDQDFRLHDAPQPCPYERCSCLEFKYLDELRQPLRP